MSLHHNHRQFSSVSLSVYFLAVVCYLWLLWSHNECCIRFLRITINTRLCTYVVGFALHQQKRSLNEGRKLMTACPCSLMSQMAAHVMRAMGRQSKPHVTMPLRTASLGVRITNQRQLLYSWQIRRSASMSSVDTSSVACLQQIYVDFKHIRDNVDSVKANASLRGMNMDGEIDEMLEAYRKFCERAAAVSETRAEQKKISKMIAHAAMSTRPILIAESKALKTMIASLECEEKHFQQQMWSIARCLPNDTHPSSPIGWEENATVVTVRGFAPNSSHQGGKLRDHLQIVKDLDIVDFEAGAAVSGRGYVRMDDTQNG